jgi:HPt (histidine-containing phosphotransfer) domain-containing protein
MASAKTFDDSKPMLLAEPGCLVQENLEALAALISRSLPPNMTARVARKGDRLGILLEASIVPDRIQATLIQPEVRRGQIHLQGIQTLKVYGRQIGQVSPAWCIVFPTILSNQQKLYGYFVTEAQELLKELEQNLLSFREDHGLAKIHNLLLAVHTIKGGSASVGLQTIAKIAHGIEDVFAALRYSEEDNLDLELELLLLKGYECLQMPLMAQFARIQIDEPEALNRAASVIAQIQAKLGDCFDQEMPILTSVDLGFDLVQNLFQVSVAQRLGDLERSLLYPQVDQLIVLLHEKAEFFLGVAESMNLPGFGAIAQTVLTALQVNPQQVLKIATIALADFSQGRAAVLGGDRQEGGFPSVKLKELAIVGNLSNTLDDTLPPLQNLVFQPLAHQEQGMNDVSPLLDLPIDAELSLDEVFGQYGK